MKIVEAPTWLKWLIVFGMCGFIFACVASWPYLLVGAFLFMIMVVVTLVYGITHGDK